jgi:hypothetical protein
MGALNEAVEPWATKHYIVVQRRFVPDVAWA